MDPPYREYQCGAKHPNDVAGPLQASDRRKGASSRVVTSCFVSIELLTCIVTGIRLDAVPRSG